MSNATSDELPAMVSGESRNGKASFVGLLDSGELLTGTPTVVEVEWNEETEEYDVVSPSVFTTSNIAVNAAVVIINGESAPIGKAVLFRVTDGGDADAGEYVLRVTCGTDATPAQSFTRFLRLEVVKR